MLALSHGGLYSLLTLREVNLDGVMISAGYTAAVGTPLYDPNNDGYARQSQFFGDLVFNLAGDSTKSIIEKNNSDYLFTWETGSTFENSGHYTQNFYGPQPNVKYNYNYGPLHSFPPCPIFTTFFDTVRAKAKPTIKEISKTCNPISSTILIKFSGKKPFTFDLYRNNTVLNNYTLNQDTMYLNLTQAGAYQIVNVTDSAGKPGFKSDIYEFIPDANISIQQVSKSFNCDSSKFKYVFQLNGNPYWEIGYSKNGFLNVVQNLFSDSLVTFWNDGIYNLHYIKDNNGCVKYINDSFLVNTNLGFNDIFSTIKYQCDSNYSKLSLSPAFSEAVKIYFIKNSLPDSASLSTNSISLQNGNYHFTKIVFSNGCFKTLNFDHQINENPLTFNFVESKYICDSNKNQISISLSGKSPWNIFYKTDTTFNLHSSIDSNITFLVENGTTLITSIFDGNQCLINPFHISTFHDTSVFYQLIQKKFSCDSNKTQFDIQLYGKSPWLFFFSKNGIDDSIHLTSSTISLYFNNGEYLFKKLVDSNKCEFYINENYSLLDSIPSAQLLKAAYNCTNHTFEILYDMQGRPPFILNYFANGIAQSQTFLGTSINLNLINNNYFISHIIDSNSCTLPLNQQYLVNYDSLHTSASTPLYDCDSNKTAIQFFLSGNSPFIIHYLKNNQIDSFSSNNNMTKFFGNDSYNFLYVSDATGCIDSLNFNDVFSYDTLGILLGLPTYSCDSNKTKITFNLNGNPPFTIHYFENLISKQLTTNSQYFEHYFLDGNYFFQKVVDSTGCEKSITQQFSFSSQPISGSITQQKYNCDSNKYQIDFLFTGIPPWQLQYTDGTTNFTTSTSNPLFSLFLPNGNWTIIKVGNIAGCEHQFNLPLTLNFSAITANILNQVYDCDSNKLKVQFALAGNAPWNIHYVENGVLPVYNTETTFNANAALYLPNGSFTFLNVIDTTGCSIAPLLQTANNNFTALSATMLGQSFSCDSMKIKVDYKLKGDAPWTLNIKNNLSSSIYSTSSYDSLISLYFNNGNYTVLSVQDAKCNIIVNDTLQISFVPLSASLTNKQIECDSNKFKVSLIAHGGFKPYTYEYYYNSILNNFTTYSDTTILFLSNGNYLFYKLTDSLGCDLLINQIVNSNYHDFHFNSLSSKYLCDKDSTQIVFDITHQTPIWLLVSKNSSTFDTLAFPINKIVNLANGDYHFNILYDSLGCSDTINQILSIQNEPVGLAPVIITKDCDLRNYIYQFELDGKSPWNLFYNHNNLLDTLIIPSSSFQWSTSPGEYNLIQIVDSNQCSIIIGKQDSLIPFFSENPILQLRENIFSTNAGGQRYLWFRNNVQIDSTSLNSIATAGDGEYYVVIHDQTGCDYTSNKIQVNYPSSITIFPNPSQHYTSILVNVKYGNSWDYILMDMHGKRIMSGNETSPYKKLDVRHLEAGIYNLIIRYESDFSKHLFRLIKD